MEQYKNPVKLPLFTVKQVCATLTQTVDWGLMNLKIPNTWSITKGKGIVVLIIDTGCPVTKSNGEIIVHPDLQGCIDVSKCKSFILTEGIEDLQGHGCVSPDTFIHTSYGGIEQIESLYDRIQRPEYIELDEDGNEIFIKNIEDLKIKTHTVDEHGNNNINYITKLHKNVISGKIINVLLDGKISYKLTPWHNVCIIRNGKYEKIRADQLKLDDGFIRPLIAKDFTKDYIITESAEYYECLNCGKQVTHISPRNQKYIQCKNCNKNKWKHGYFKEIVNEDFAYLIGVIITDGHLNLHKKYCVEISSNTKEIIEKCSFISNKLGFGAGFVVNYNNRKCYNLKINSKRLIKALLNLGILAKGKSYYQTMPEFVGKSPLNVIYSFLAGVIDGDGCISNDNIRNKITTISKTWAYQLCYLMNSLSINSRIDINKNIGFNKIQSTEYPFVYNCNFSKPPIEIVEKLAHPIKKQRGLKEISDTKLYKNVKEIAEENYNGFFYDFTVENDHTYIANGHFVSNTHCAGIIGARDNVIGCVGYAPECTIVTYKGLDKNGLGSMDQITAALEYAADILKPDIVSMSLGSTAPDSKMHQAIKRLFDMNIPVIAAGGNGGKVEGVNYPGNYDEVITIGAYDINDKIAYFSAVGEGIDFVFPGVEIYSTYLNNGYAKFSGTSMATPAAAGVVALLLAKHKKQEAETGMNDCRTVDQIKEHLKKYAIDVGPKGKDQWFGYGIIDVSKLLLTPENVDPSKIITTTNAPVVIKRSWWRRLFGWIRDLI